MNVTAAAKGLVAGYISIELLDGTVMDILSGGQVGQSCIVLSPYTIRSH